MANIYIRKSGNDSNDGSTPALAKLTIENAFSAASNADRLIIGAGIYSLQSALNNTSKYCDFYGDVDGQLTGDAGEVIIDGLNSSTYAYISFATSVFNLSTSSTSNFENLILQNIKTANNYVISGKIDIDKCSINNILGNVISIRDGSNINKLSIFDIISENQTTYGIHLTVAGTYNVDDLLIDGMCSSYSAPYIFGIMFSAANTTLNIRNSTIKNVWSGKSYTAGIGTFASGSGTITVNITNVNLINNYQNARMAGNGWTWALTINNCNSWGEVQASTGLTGAEVTAYSEHCINIPHKISRFCQICGAGHSDYPSTDLNSEPRPAYGNTNPNIGALETTHLTVQKETTVYDAGATSLKVHPCQFFKRVFQIPVTASTLRTVKAKIRIDGTWPSGSRPRISLSGQGMTLSQATKNSTTGSFEELTVSGTPTTTGIALLTIEGHATNTDAYMYMDTITIS